MKRWTSKQLFGEIAAILVRLDNDRVDDARYMAKVIVGDTSYHKTAIKEYTEDVENS